MTQGFQYSDKFYSSVDRRASDTATIVFKTLRNYLHVESIVDAGCGSGAWVRSAIAEGMVRAYGIDLGSSLNLISGNISFKEILANGKLILKERDFVEDSESKLPSADLAICLEVAEHLPTKIATTVVAQLTEASKFVVFSAAQPGQGGTYHINERPLEYWVKEFAKYDFVPFDPFREVLRKGNNVPRFYALNMLLFVSKESFESDNRIIDKTALALVKITDLSQLEKRTPLERFRYALLRKLPVSVVTALSMRLKY